MKAEKHITLLNALKYFRTVKQRQTFIQSLLPDSTVKAICEALYNITQNNCSNISSKQIKKLCKYKRIVRQLTNKPHFPLVRKRRIIANQKGGFLSATIPLILLALQNVL